MRLGGCRSEHHAGHSDVVCFFVLMNDSVDALLYIFIIIADALHLAHLIASHGYLFQIDDHVLTVKNDGTFYRFQNPYFWPSNCWEPENTDYGECNVLVN